MATWIFNTPTVDESPFAWNSLMERFRISRGISVKEIAPCQYVTVRYDAYTNELGANNLQPQANVNTEFWPQPSEGLNYFRGGYDHIVSDETRTCLILSGVATEANFRPLAEAGAPIDLFVTAVEF